VRQVYIQEEACEVVGHRAGKADPLDIRPGSGDQVKEDQGLHVRRRWKGRGWVGHQEG
jgi:hypothetical protein